MDLSKHILFKRNTKDVKLGNPGRVDSFVLGKIFKLVASSIFLEEEASGIVIIPTESGRFQEGELVVERTYIVHGDGVPDAETRRSPSLPQRPSFFSSTPTPLPLPTSSAVARVSYSSLIPSTPQPNKRQQSWKKSVLLMDVAEMGRPSQSFQVHLTLTEETSTVPIVLELLEKQLGFKVVIYDSKWLPIQDNVGTRGKSCDFLNLLQTNAHA